MKLNIPLLDGGSRPATCAEIEEYCMMHYGHSPEEFKNYHPTITKTWYKDLEEDMGKVKATMPEAQPVPAPGTQPYNVNWMFDYAVNKPTVVCDFDYAQQVTYNSLEAKKPPIKNKKKDSTMCYRECDECGYSMTVETQTPEQAKAEYLTDRLRSAYRSKDADLRKAFFLDNDLPPTTVEELVARIKAGQFVAPTKEKEEADARYYGFRPLQQITWRDPAKPADQEGYKAAEAKLDAANLAARDTIMIGTPAEGLKALQDFEAATFS